MMRCWPGRLIIGGMFCVLGGCAVQPGSDYRQAADLITERLGAAEVYDPQADALVHDKVEALLADGLTIDEAVTLAMLNNRRFQAAFHEIGVSRAELVQSGLFSNPSVSFVGKLPAGGGRSNLEIGLAQELADLWQIPIRKKIARAELEAAILDVAQRAIDLNSEVRSAAYQVLTLRESEETVRETLELIKQSEELARRRFEAGETSQLDVNLAKLNTVDMRIELLQVQRELGLAEANLARLLCLSDREGTWFLNDRLPEPKPLAVQPSLLELALTQRLDARAAEYRVAIAEHEIERAWANVFPSFSAGYEIERLEGRSLPGRKLLADTVRESIGAGALTAPPLESRAQRARDKRQNVQLTHGPGFSATLPIWDQNQAQIAKARIQAQQRCKEYEDVLDQIANEVKRANVSLTKSLEIVQSYQEQSIPQSTVSLQSAQRLYEAGEEGIVVVIEAQESLINRRRAYVRALGEYAAALAEAERVVGGRLAADVAADEQPVTSQPAVGS